ncbi:ras family-domain-containing protein [Chlamydoabsidia padenii]|nr:ras family-domain-containing protein [Chlamydoabsidia padenii]
MSTTDEIRPTTQRILSPQHQLKLVLLGESAVGKTSFLHRFIDSDYYKKRENTVGAGFHAKSYKVGDRVIKLNCWDTAGQDHFHSLAPMYYRGAQAAIVMYDVTKQETFGRAKIWVRELQRQASPHIVIALVGNKIDLCDSIPTAEGQFDEHDKHQDRKVTTEDAARYAADYPLLFFETSARLNINVDTVFTEIAHHVPEEYLTPVRQPGGNLSSTTLDHHANDDNNSTISLTNEGDHSIMSNSGCAC